jgi:hypothetical protein
MSASPIRRQVTLPLSVAWQVVLQGIRIRLGRSLVTLMGVLLGIAFLMSILTGQSIRQGVRRETEARAECRRMIGFLTAETGPLRDRAVGVIQAGAISDIERRLAAALLDEGASEVRWAAVAGAAMPAGLPAGRVRAAEPRAAAEGAAALLLVGEGASPDLRWGELVAGTRQRVLAVARATPAPEAGADATVLSLAREPHPDELAEQRSEARRTRFRTAWIIAISLLVTVIGISNAMLMSVTERFREIGTMKCLGALSAFVRQMFFIEACLLGVVGAAAGCVVGAAFAAAAFSLSYGMDLVVSAMSPWTLLAHGALCVAAGVGLSIVAAIYPASFASRMVPATALRSTI